MGIKVWFGGEFDYGHERAALTRLLEEAVPRFSEELEPYALFVDFWVGTAKIDLMAITERALVIIDFKEVTHPNGYFRGQLQNPWVHSSPDGHSYQLTPETEKNPLRQVDRYRNTMIRWLGDRTLDVFGHQKALLLKDSQGNSAIPKIIDAWIVVTPSIDEERTARELAPIMCERPWFKVMSLDRLCNELFRLNSRGYTITEDEIKLMADFLALEEKKSFAGFLWPGTLREPKPLLFRDPPQHRFKVGRKAELKQAVDALAAKATILSLVGVKGVGKTHLTVALVDEVGEGRLVRWVDCGSTRSCEVTLETLLLALAYEMPQTADQQFVADREQPIQDRIERALKWCDEKSLVLVFDEYNELSADHGINQFIRKVDECCHTTQVIVTSNRSPDFLSDPDHPLDAAYTLTLGGLSRDDTMLYIKTRASKNNHYLDLQHTNPQFIWEQTGGLPEVLEHLVNLSANRAPEQVLQEAAGATWEDTAHNLLKDVMTSVSPEAQRLAAACTVVRRGLDRAFVLALAAPDAGQTLLNELVDGCILTSSGDRGLVLPGGLRQYLEDMLEETPELRRGAHRRAAAHLLAALQSGEGQDFVQREEALWHASEAEEYELVLEHAGPVVEALSHQGEYARALQRASAAEKAAEMLADQREIAHWQIEEGAILRHTGKAEESERLCRQGLAVGEALGDNRLQARAYHVLGSLALAHADHEAARKYCEAALDLDRSLGDRSHEAASLARLAGIESATGKLPKAEDLYRQSLALTEKESERPEELARRHFDLSLVQKYDDRLEDALAHLEQAWSYAQIAAIPSQMAVVLGQLAEVKGRLKRYDEALQALEQAVQLRNALPDPRKALITLGIRVDIYIDMGDVRRAAMALKQLETEGQKVDDPITQAFLKKRRGLVMLLQHQEGEGLALVDEACRVFRSLGRDHWVADCQATVDRILDRADRTKRPTR